MNKFFQHTIGIIVTTFVLTIVPIGICGAMLIMENGNDVGSPLIIFLFPIACFAAAIEISCLLLAPLAEFLRWVSNRWHWPLWLSPFVVLFLCSAVLLPIIFFTGHFPEWEIVTLLGIVYLTVGFIAYWLTLLFLVPRIELRYRIPKPDVDTCPNCGQHIPTPAKKCSECQIELPEAKATPKSSKTYTGSFLFGLIIGILTISSIGLSMPPLSLMHELQISVLVCFLSVLCPILASIIFITSCIIFLSLRSSDPSKTISRFIKGLIWGFITLPIILILALILLMIGLKVFP